MQIRPGITGLLGPNGSGKSTLIKSLLGLVRPQSGSGRVLDFVWPRDARAIRDCVGYLPEDDCYIAGLTGIESVALMARLSGLAGQEGLRRSHEMLDYCGFGEERYREVETYSTGMRQKLKFAQTLVHDPPLLILDEPTTGLDPDQRVAMLNRIRSLAVRHGKSVILSTHILHDVRSVCDQVIILVDGTLRVVDTLENLSRPSEPTMRVVITGDADAFVEAARGAGLKVRSDEEYGAWCVEPVELEQVDQLWRIAASTNTSIRSLQPAVNSLDKIFMDAAAGKLRTMPERVTGVVDADS